MASFAVMNHAVWGEISPELIPAEFHAPEKMDVDFLRLMSKVRRAAKVPFRIVSDSRTPETNPGAEQSAHLELPCKAIDLRVITNYERFAIIRAALALGVRRIGIYPATDGQKAEYGPAVGSLHLDSSTINPQDRLWTSF